MTISNKTVAGSLRGSSEVFKPLRTYTIECLDLDNGFVMQFSGLRGEAIEHGLHWELRPLTANDPMLATLNERGTITPEQWEKLGIDFFNKFKKEPLRKDATAHILEQIHALQEKGASIYSIERNVFGRNVLQAAWTHVRCTALKKRDVWLVSRQNKRAARSKL